MDSNPSFRFLCVEAFAKSAKVTDTQTITMNREIKGA